MIVYFVLFVLLCLYKIKIKPDATGFQSDYMSVEKTTAIKGIFIIVVFFSHFKNYIDIDNAWIADVKFYDFLALISQRMVTPFLFFSGYGVMESISKKGIKYIHSIPKKRILHVLVEFDIAILAFTIVDIILKIPFSNGKMFDIKQVALSLVGWSSVGNSNWYIFSILVAYIITYIAFKLFNGKKILSALGVTILLSAFIVTFRLFNIKEAYWYNTVICYAGGMWFSILRPAVEKLLMKNIVWVPVFIVSLAMCLYSFKLAHVNFVLYEISMCLFIWTIVVFTMKISICNKPLIWFGRNLFPLYIFQRLPMMIFKHLGLADFNTYLFFIVCFVSTLGIAWLFSKFSKWLWSPKTKQVKAER